MNQLIIDPIPKHMRRVYGPGNAMRRNAFVRTEVGKKYYLPVPWQSETSGDSGKHIKAKYEMMTCISKQDSFAVFRTSKQLTICFSWYDLAVEYSKGAVL